MLIDFEEEEMIVPKNIIPVSPSFKGISAIINYYVNDGILVKRIEAAGKQAILYNGNNNDIAKIYNTEFVIINALFVTFTPKTPEDYLCLIGTDEIDFYALKDGMYCSISLPFKVSQAHPSNFGLILERSSFPGEFGNTPGVAQLFSLTHPYNEILPILCKFKGDSQCHYAFRYRRIAVVPKDIGANWNAAYSGHIDLVMCYDHDERTNHIFMIRKCTKEERMAAKSDLGVLNSSALLHTPSTIQSYYSPNFFNRRFVETRFVPVGLMNAQQKSNQSPTVNSILFPNYSHSNPRQQNNNSIASVIANNANSSVIAPPKATPLRRITRSMTAAFAVADTISGGPSLPSSGTEKSPAFHRSLEHNATLNRMRLKQKLAMATSQNSKGHSNNIFHTPRHGASFTTNVDMDDLLSFGGKEEDDEPPPSLDIAVEFCLEWLWSESPPCPALEESTTRSASSSSMGTEKVANILETLRVSSSTSSQSDEAANINRMASTFFISKSAFARTERCIVFHIPVDRRIGVLSMDLSTKPMDSPINQPIINEMTGTFIRGNSAIPFMHSSFFMILDSFSFYSAQSSIITLYSGHRKIANIPLNIGMSNNLVRLLPGVPCPDSQHLYEIRIFADHEENNVAEFDGLFPSAGNDVTTPNIYSCQLQLGFATKLANRCLRAVYAWIGSDKQFQFLSHLFCSNPWRMVSAAQKIPFIDELPAECLELGLLLEQLYLEYGYPLIEMPFFELISRIRSQINEGMEGGEECSATKRTRLEQNNAEMLQNDNFWNQLKLDQKIAEEAFQKLDKLGVIKYVPQRLRDTLRRVVREERRIQPPKFEKDISTKKSSTLPINKWISTPKWKEDLRVHNVQQMLDSSLPILIPAKAFGHSFNEVQQREQNEQFLLAVALRTVTRSFGRAALNLRIRHGFEEEKEQVDPQMGVRALCLNGRVHPGWQQIDFPLNDTNPSHKNAMDWANFYNALAHGISYCGGFPARLFNATTREENLSSTVKAGLLLAAGLTGSVRNAMNLYDIHALLTQSDRHLVIALLIGCAAASGGTSEVHIYKMIATHLPFLLQPTLCEFRIELVIQTAALVSLGLLFSETANYTVSSQLLNQMALETPCESDQAFERYSFVLAAGMAIGLINLAKGKEITDTEIPISFWPSLKDRLIKMLNGGERRQAYLNYDRIQCPGMRVANGLGCSISRKYAPGGMDGIADNNNANNNNGQQGGAAVAAAANAANNQSFSGAPTCDYSGIGHPSSSHVRELPTLNIHLTAPAAAIALGLMYLRTGDAWIRDTLSIKDTFYEIDKNRPDMLMIRTICKCLVDFDDIKPNREWAETQIPEIVRKYVKIYLRVKNREDLWWDGFVEMDTVAKAYFYCLTGACLSIALRFASTCDEGALESIHHLYELLHEKSTPSDSEYSWLGLVIKAGRNCVRTCINVLALCLGLVMAGSGDLQTTRLLRKIRNSIPENSGGIPPKDSSVHSLHVSVNMALGFLYLGHGRYCFSNSNLAVAALVLSLFPLFPHSITDNRFYFQPIRFLWVLAVKSDSKQIQPGEEKMNKESQKGGEEELVDCFRCGNIKITKNDKFIFD